MNRTNTYLAEHLVGLQHDNVQYVHHNHALHTTLPLVAGARKFVGSAQGCLLFDNTVLDKHYSQRID